MPTFWASVRNEYKKVSENIFSDINHLFRSGLMLTSFDFLS
jgi:hypothetical protein